MRIWRRRYVFTQQQSDDFYDVPNHEKCKDNAKEIADLNDVVHSQEQELKGYDEEVRFCYSTRDSNNRGKHLS